MTIPNVVGDAIQLGRSADPSKNFLICVPDVADGTLTIKRGDDTVVASIDAAGKVSFPGNTQTWQDVSASRSLNTSYINTTGQPICVFFGATTDTEGQAVLVVDNIYLYGSTAAGNKFSSICALVPPGGYYMCTSSGTVTNVLHWKELR